jgi:hypothetical protein
MIGSLFRSMLVISIVSLLSACASFNSQDINEVPIFIDIGEVNDYRLTPTEHYLLSQYHSAKSTEEALDKIPEAARTHLQFRPGQWGLHIAYGYLLDHLMKREVNHPELLRSKRFYADLVTKYPNNDVVLYWAARAYDRFGLAVNGLATRYYELAMSKNDRNLWYMRDYVRGPNPAPPGTEQPFFRAEPGKYQRLFPVYSRLGQLARTKEESKRWLDEFKLLVNCQGKKCDFKAIQPPK